MEVLNNGFITKFWLPIEDEPDIDRFIDEDIAVDLNGFTLQGILRKVSTSKKKNEEKEWEYYKEITIEVSGISNGESQVTIPDKKDEYECAAEFRYIPDNDLEEKVKGPSSEEQVEADLIDPAKDPQDEAYEGNEAEFDEEQQAELDHQEEQLIKDEAEDEADAMENLESYAAEGDADDDDFNFADEPAAANAIVEPEDEKENHAPDAINGTPDDEFFELTQVDNGTGEKEKKNPDDDGIDWE